MSAVRAATVGIGTALVVLASFVLVIVGGLLAIRRQNRMFPKGFDRTGWTPERVRASWFAPKFTWLGGGRG